MAQNSIDLTDARRAIKAAVCCNIDNKPEKKTALCFSG
jgi:hypothetical protein